MDFKSYLKNSVSGLVGARYVAGDAAPEQPALKRRDELGTLVSGTRREQRRKMSTAGKPYRRIKSFERRGPFYTQVGIKNVAGKDIPVMATRFQYWMLHSTKGWRSYRTLPFSLRA